MLQLVAPLSSLASIVLPCPSVEIIFCNDRLLCYSARRVGQVRCSNTVWCVPGIMDRRRRGEGLATTVRDQLRDSCAHDTKHSEGCRGARHSLRPNTPTGPLVRVALAVIAFWGALASRGRSLCSVSCSLRWLSFPPLSPPQLALCHQLLFLLLLPATAPASPHRAATQQARSARLFRVLIPDHMRQQLRGQVPQAL